MPIGFQSRLAEYHNRHSTLPVMLTPEAQLSVTTPSTVPPSYQSLERLNTARIACTQSSTSSAQREPKEHIFGITGSKNKSWATLKLQTYDRQVVFDARTSTQLPTFFEGDQISGSLEVSAEKWDSVEAIDMSITGNITAGISVDSMFTFLDITRVLWSKVTGTAGRVNEAYSFPFSVSLPRDVAVVPKTSSTPEVFRLPPSISERHTKATISYELMIHIHRRGLLRSGPKSTIIIAYVPSIRPDPASAGRQQVYKDKTPIPGPHCDPDGWLSSKPTPIHGRVGNKANVSAKFILSLAKPASYTRGSVIPLAMHIDADDSKDLGVFSSPNAIFVCLRRHVSYNTDAPAPPVHKSDYEWKDQVYDYELALWWLNQDRNTDEKENFHERRMNGEIALPKDLIPSSCMAHFSVSYSVIVFPFDAPSFTPRDTEPLLSVPVEVATKYPSGPRPLSYAPPEY